MLPCALASSRVAAAAVLVFALHSFKSLNPKPSARVRGERDKSNKSPPITTRLLFSFIFVRFGDTETNAVKRVNRSTDYDDEDDDDEKVLLLKTPAALPACVRASCCFKHQAALAR